MLRGGQILRVDSDGALLGTIALLLTAADALIHVEYLILALPVSSACVNGDVAVLFVVLLCEQSNVILAFLNIFHVQIGIASWQP